MSETASPPPVTGGDDRVGPVHPPANSQPALSVSDAARMLRQQRGQGQSGQQGFSPQGLTGQHGTQPAQIGGESRPNRADSGVSPAESAPKRAETSESREGLPPARPADGLSAMERSLGLSPEVVGTPETAESAIDLDGKRYSTTELREAMSKAADYTRKTQQLAAEARQLAEQQQTLRDVLPYLQPEIQRLMEMAQQAPPRPDAALLQTDPATYFAQREAYEKALENHDRLSNIQRVQAAAQQRLFEQQVADGNRQLEAEFPWWADPQERQKARQEIIDWATSKGGFTLAELGQVSDPRHLKLMMRAAAWDKWAASVKTTSPRTTAVSASRGAPPPPAPTERVEQAYAAFEAAPSFRTGAALLSARRANGGGGGNVRG